jgi:signal transduction histidine kinase
MNDARGMDADLARGVVRGGGETGELIRSIDWSRTTVGAMAGWPASLRTALSMMLGSRFPMFLWWGPSLVNFYNDGYIPVLGQRHPAAMGARAPQVWSEIWDVVGPQAEIVMRQGEATWNDRQLLVMERNGFVEETYFSWSYSPAHDESGNVAGVFCACTEDTRRVLGERRLRTLRELAADALAAQSVHQACERAAQAMAGNRYDVPFALIYLQDGGGRASLAASMGYDGAPPRVDMREMLAAGEWPLPSAGIVAPGAPWPEPVTRALVVPIAQAGSESPAGVLVAAISPRLALDQEYREFLDLVGGQLARAISDANAFEAERRRAQTLEELDRAKTAFFSNISHEFRTPLTLMLGPLEDLLAGPDLGPDARETLSAVQRNAGRLLKLVNTLLDFARIEAGRVQAVYEPTDLAGFTAALASTFRSACQRAGLALDVTCPPLSEPAYVDPEMWEKIVLNLVSNAFKFTLRGGIAVSVREAPESFELEVSDTGAGIPAAELPRMFERFHRIEGVQGRSHEGSGIGLALVHELVKAHGGSIRVASEPGRGSAFTVAIPKGRAHLPSDRVGGRGNASPSRARAYVDEALSWLPGAEQPAAPAHAADTPRVLVADDNADLRAYAARLLGEHYRVEAVADGEAALAAARRQRPEIVVADVMMPRMDGFALLHALRSDPSLAGVPVVLLSARAGEEAVLEGLERGADDYLVKPFSARELLVRVGALLHAAAARREAEQKLRTADRAKDEFLATLAHELRNPLAPLRAGLDLMKRPNADERVRTQARAVMERQVAHMVRLIDDLLDVSRITHGRLELKFARVDLAQAAQQAIEAVRPAIEAAGHTLTYADPAMPLIVAADVTRIVQIISNLLNNAARYTPAGGRIELSLGHDDGQALITVRDSGIGIAAHMLDRIFDMFQRGEPGKANPSGGLGIGLGLTKRLVELHGGTIAARSAGPGQGSDFTARLPLAVDVVAAGVDGAPVPRGRLTGKRVLVVDDSRDAAEMLASLLTLQGNDTRIAYDGQEAVHIALTYRPQLVLLDLGMPRMNGFEACQAIRRGWSGGPPPYIVALTGWGQDADRARTEQAGFDAHLVKPVQLEDVERLALEAMAD